MTIEPSTESLTAETIEDLRVDDLFPGMPSPGDDVVHTEGILRAWDGTDLFWQTWEPRHEPRGVVCLMHGFGEHSARYHHLATFLVRAGYAVMAIDARGHGRSGGRRAHVQDFDEYPRDLDRLVAEAEERWPDQHLVVFGHSNGGLIALHHALMNPGRAAAYAITSPFLGFQVKVPAWKAGLGNLMSSVWPTLAIPTELSPDVLTHDREVVQKYANDPLVTDVATARWFTETKEAQRRILKNAAQVRAPFLFLVAGSDELADPATAEEVYHELGSPEREFEIFPDLLHEVMNESEWQRLSRRVLGWFERFR